MSNRIALQEAVGDADFIAERAANLGRTIALNVVTAVRASSMSVSVVDDARLIAADFVNTRCRKMARGGIPDNLVDLYRDQFESAYNETIRSAFLGARA